MSGYSVNQLPMVPLGEEKLVVVSETSFCVHSETLIFKMLGGEVFARPPVQESNKKAMHRVVVAVSSLVRYEFVPAECIIHPHAFLQLWTQAEMHGFLSVTTSVSRWRCHH